MNKKAEGYVLPVVIVVAALIVVGGIYGNSQGWFDKKADEGDTGDTGGDTGGNTGGTTGGDTTVVVIKEPSAPSEQQQPSAPPTQEKLPIETLVGIANDKFTLAAVTVGNLSFYKKGSDVSDPNVLHIDYIDLSTAASSTTRQYLTTNTDYDLYYVDKAGTRYDDKIANYAIAYNPDTGKGTLRFGDSPYHPISVVGAQVDQDTLPEVQSGVNDTGTDTIKYVEASLGGSFWIQMDIGNANSNSELRSEVFCIRDNDGDMDGDEVTALSASYISGSTAITLPGSLLVYWQGAMGGGGAQCFKIADVLGSSQQARWKFQFSVTEANFDTDEEFELTQDDVGGYLQKQYPSRHAKAAAESLTIADA